VKYCNQFRIHIHVDTNSKIRGKLDKYAAGHADQIIPVMRRVGSLLKAGTNRLQYPCSLEQRRIWLLHQANPHHPALNLVVRWQPQRAVSIIELESALQTIIARHQVLRTLFIDMSGRIIQLVEPHVVFNVTAVDLTGIAQSQKLIESRNIALIEKNTAFNLSMTPLLRVKYVHIDPDSSEILVTLHHIVCDVNSVEILLREINHACAALQEGRPHALPESPVKYGDFTTRQVEQLTHPVPQAELDYWKQELQNFKYFEIQPDYARPKILSANTDTLSLPLDNKLIDELALIGLQHGATLSMTIATVLLILLYRYTGETDITIGRQLSNRDNEGLKNLVGLIGSVLVIRNDLSGDPDFIALLARTRNKFCTAPVIVA
jgi:Condensation domain